MTLVCAVCGGQDLCPLPFLFQYPCLFPCLYPYLFPCLFWDSESRMGHNRPSHDQFQALRLLGQSYLSVALWHLLS